jgi:predicted O-methyltransferase YrrM
VDLVRRVRRRLRRRARAARKTIPYDSEYLHLLNQANAGMLYWGQPHLFDLAVRELPTTDPVLEIGSFCGQSTNTLAYFLRKHGRANVIFTTDPWVFEGDRPEGVPSAEEFRRYVRKQFERNVLFWSRDRLPHTFQLPSDEFFNAWQTRQMLADLFGRETELGGPIAFAFIDGAHDYPQVRRDFENVNRHLVPGGLILFDDSDPFGRHPGVYPVVKLALAKGYELVAENPHHLIRKLVNAPPRRTGRFDG